MVVHQHLILLQFSSKKKMYVRLHFPFSPRLKRLICLFITTATTLVYHQSLLLLQGLFSSMINRNCSTVVLLCGGEISNTTRRYDQKMPTQQASSRKKKTNVKSKITSCIISLVIIFADTCYKKRKWKSTYIRKKGNWSLFQLSPENHFFTNIQYYSLSSNVCT